MFDIFHVYDQIRCFLWTVYWWWDAKFFNWAGICKIRLMEFTGEVLFRIMCKQCTCSNYCQVNPFTPPPPPLDLGLLCTWQFCGYCPSWNHILGEWINKLHTGTAQTIGEKTNVTLFKICGLEKLKTFGIVNQVYFVYVLTLMIWFNIVIVYTLCRLVHLCWDSFIGSSHNEV